MTSKSKLNLYCQKSHSPTPCYTTESTDHGFVSTVTVKFEVPGCSVPAPNECFESHQPQSTKKAAENDAATAAVNSVVRRHPGYSNIDEILDWLDSQGATNSTKKRSTNRQQSANKEAVITPQPPQSLQSHIFIQPPVGVTPSPRKVPADGRPLVPPSQITMQGPSGPGSASVHPHQQSNVQADPHTPDQWDRNRGKPLKALKIDSPANAPLTSPTIATTCPNLYKKSKHQWTLEEYCKTHNLPEPKYSIRQEKTNQYTAVVIIGAWQFSTEYEYDTFDKAKDNATLLAIAELGVKNLTIAETGQQQPTPSPVSVHPLTQPVVSKPQAPQSTVQHRVDTALQPPSYFQNTFQLAQSQAKHTTGQPTALRTIPVRGTPPTAPDLQMPRLERVPDRQQTTVDTRPPLQTQQGTKSPQKEQPSKVDLHPLPTNCKQILNEFCSKKRIPLPRYDVEYPEDSVGYIVTVSVSETKFSSPSLSSKKLAENAAAAEAIRALGILTQEKGGGATVQTVVKSVASTSAVTGESQVTRAESFISFKNHLQEHFQKLKAPLPYYETSRGDEGGFVSTVSVQQPPGGQALKFVSGGHPVKKAAEQEAARNACIELGLLQR